MRILFFIFIPLSLLSCNDKAKEKPEPELSEVQKAAIPLELEESISNGAGIYNNFCATCHLPSGEGVPNAFPPLNNSNWLTEKRKASIHAVKYGLQGEIEVNGETYDSFMPDLGLTDKEVADVMNYIFNSWSNTIKPPVTEEEVAAIPE